jgi:hypothetical protein
MMKHRFLGHKKWLLPVILLLVILVFFTPVGSYAFTYFQAKIAATGEVIYTDEVTITSWRDAGDKKAMVWVQANANTEVDHLYKIHLFYDESKTYAAEATVTWTTAEKAALVEKKVTFTGLDMSATNAIYPQVIP